MIRKWEWIREYCNRNGFEESAEIADQIDRVLCYLYEEEHTDAWREYIENGEDVLLESGGTDLSVWEVYLSIASNDEYCIACVMEGGNCGICDFARLAGCCIDDNASIYKEFRREYEAEAIPHISDTFVFK